MTVKGSATTDHPMLRSRRRSSNAKAFLFARPTRNDIRGASQGENPLGVPRFRSAIRVAPPSFSHVHVVSSGMAATASASSDACRGQTRRLRRSTPTGIPGTAPRNRVETRPARRGVFHSTDLMFSYQRGGRGACPDRARASSQYRPARSGHSRRNTKNPPCPAVAVMPRPCPQPCDRATSPAARQTLGQRRKRRTSPMPGEVPWLVT